MFALGIETSFLLSLTLLVTIFFSAIFIFLYQLLPFPACQLVTTGATISLGPLQFKAINNAILCLIPLMVVRFEELRLCMG